MSTFSVSPVAPGQRTGHRYFYLTGKSRRYRRQRERQVGQGSAESEEERSPTSCGKTPQLEEEGPRNSELTAVAIENHAR